MRFGTNTALSTSSFHKIFINLQKLLQPDPYCPLKDSLLIFIKSLCFFLFQAFFEKSELGTIRDNFVNFYKKHLDRCFIFPVFLANSD